MHGAIELHDVGKRYRRRRPDHPTRLREWLGGGWRAALHAEPFWALRHVDFVVEPGTTVGVIGPNGAGKSTLLRLVGGIGRPNEGAIAVRGRVSSLLELGAEYHHELTGRENAVIGATVAGARRREAERMIPEIFAFAELEPFVDSPMRTYSSGMWARLAFAVAMQTRPDVLLIDEALAVGDLSFRDRCVARMRSFQREGVAILLVSHEVQLVKELCDELVSLRAGQMVGHGATQVVLDTYVKEMSAETRRRTPPDLAASLTAGGVELRGGENRFGSQEATVSGVRVLDEWGESTAEVEVGRPLTLACEVTAPAELGPVQLGVQLRHADGTLCIDSSTLIGPELRRRATAVPVTLEIGRLDLVPGSYRFDIGLYDAGWARVFDLHQGAYPLLVAGAGPRSGVLAPPVVWNLGAKERGRNR